MSFISAMPAAVAMFKDIEHNFARETISAATDKLYTETFITSDMNNILYIAYGINEVLKGKKLKFTELIDLRSTPIDAIIAGTIRYYNSLYENYTNLKNRVNIQICAEKVDLTKSIIADINELINNENPLYKKLGNLLKSHEMLIIILHDIYGMSSSIVKSLINKGLQNHTGILHPTNINYLIEDIILELVLTSDCHSDTVYISPIAIARSLLTPEHDLVIDKGHIDNLSRILTMNDAMPVISLYQWYRDFIIERSKNKIKVDLESAVFNLAMFVEKAVLPPPIRWKIYTPITAKFFVDDLNKSFKTKELNKMKSLSNSSEILKQIITRTPAMIAAFQNIQFKNQSARLYHLDKLHQKLGIDDDLIGGVLIGLAINNALISLNRDISVDDASTVAFIYNQALNANDQYSLVAKHPLSNTIEYWITTALDGKAPCTALLDSYAKELKTIIIGYGIFDTDVISNALRSTYIAVQYGFSIDEKYTLLKIFNDQLYGRYNGNIKLRYTSPKAISELIIETIAEQDSYRVIGNDTAEQLRSKFEYALDSQLLTHTLTTDDILRWVNNPFDHTSEKVAVDDLLESFNKLGFNRINLS